jgi:predicted SnoaL-like aldol condensation-catalyzing enzyme
MEKFTSINKYSTKPLKKMVKLNENKSESGKDPVVKFFSKLFESKEMAHVYHLTVKGEMGSGHSHIALQEYYEKSIEIIDDLIECYMGQYDMIEGYDIIDTKVSKLVDKLDYFTDLGNWIKENRSVIDSDDTHLHSLIDDILLLIYKTCYKLKFIK